MRATAILSTLALVVGCSAEPVDVVSSPIVTDFGQPIEARTLSRAPIARDLPPYAGANWDFRLEIGLSDPGDPVMYVYPARVLCRVNGDWMGLPPQGWDDPVPVIASTRDRWAPIWQGTLPGGLLESLVIDLDEDVMLVEEDVSFEGEIPSGDRQIELALGMDTGGQHPMVVTVLVQPIYHDGWVNLDVTDVLVRKVDELGYAHGD